MVPIDPIQHQNNYNIPVNVDKTALRFTELFAHARSVAAANAQSMITLQTAVSQAEQVQEKRANLIVNAEAQLRDIDQQRQNSRDLATYIKEQSDQIGRLETALNAQVEYLTTLSEELKHKGEEEALKQVQILLQQCQETLAETEATKNESRNRDVARILSLVMLVSGFFLKSTINYATIPGEIALGAGFGAFYYVRETKETKELFTIKKLFKHMAIGAGTNLLVANLANPLFKKIGGWTLDVPKNLLKAGFVCTTLTLSLECFGKVVSQAALSAIGLCIKKCIVDEKKPTRSEIQFAIIASSCGALACFSVEKGWVEQIAHAGAVIDALHRGLAKGIGEFAKQAASMITLNKLRGEEWHKGAWNAGLEAFFWSMVHQVADHIRVNKLVFEEHKKNVLNWLDEIALPGQEKLKEKIRNATSEKEINEILQGPLGQKLVEEMIKSGKFSEADIKLVTDSTTNADPSQGVHGIIKLVFKGLLINANLPQDIKDKAAKVIEDSTTLQEIRTGLKAILKELSELIGTYQQQGKTWLEVREVVKGWIVVLTGLGFFPADFQFTGLGIKDQNQLNALAEKIFTDGYIEFKNGGHNRGWILLDRDKGTLSYVICPKNIDFYKSKHLKSRHTFNGELVNPSMELDSLTTTSKNLTSLLESGDKIGGGVLETSTASAISDMNGDLNVATFNALTPEAKRQVLVKLTERMNEIREQKNSCFTDLHIPTVEFKSREIPEPKPRPPIKNITAAEFVLKNIPKGAAIPALNKPAANPAAIPEPLRSLPVILVNETDPELLPVQLLHSHSMYNSRLSLNRVELGAEVATLVQTSTPRLVSPPAPVAVLPVAVNQSALRRQRHIKRLELQIAQCADGKAGRAKKRSLQLQLTIYKTS